MASFTSISHASRRCIAIPPTIRVLNSPAAPVSHFSTSPCSQNRRTAGRRDNNPNRGLSAIRGTGLRKRQKLSVRPEDIKLPVKGQPAGEVEVPDDHGLWGFFHSDRSYTPEASQILAFGRAWTQTELERRSWDELHKLWWICVKERNMIASHIHELDTSRPGVGIAEFEDRDKPVRETMKTIKKVLTLRWYAWEDARQLALNDKDVQFDRTGTAWVTRQSRKQENGSQEDGELLERPEVVTDEVQTGSASREARQ